MPFIGGEMPAGRPTDYTLELGKEICKRLGRGETLIKICSEEGMPCRETVWAWRQIDEEFNNIYARAREEQAWTFVEECLHISDETQFDMTEDDNGKPIVNWEHIQRSRLKVDTRKWIATKIAARVFGEKITQEHSGPEGGPIETRHYVDAPPEETRADWEARVFSNLDKK